MANLLTRRRTDPFAPMFGDWMDDFWNRTNLLPMPRYADMPAMERALMDVVDKGDAFEVKVDMPGVKKENINVEIEGNQVTIGAEVKREWEKKEGEKMLRSERYYGNIYRSFTLPHELEEAKCVAKYDGGVLELKLVKKAGVAGKKLPVM